MLCRIRCSDAKHLWRLGEPCLLLVRRLGGGGTWAVRVTIRLILHRGVVQGRWHLGLEGVLPWSAARVYLMPTPGLRIALGAAQGQPPERLAPILSMRGCMPLHGFDSTARVARMLQFTMTSSAA